MDYVEGKGVRFALMQLKAAGLTPGPARTYWALKNRFGADVDVIFEGLMCEAGAGAGGGGGVPALPGVRVPVVPGATAPGSTAEQESFLHRTFCSPTLKSGLESLAATMPADPTTRARVQGALAALELYCSGGSVNRRVVMQAVCGLSSLPGVRERLAAMGTGGIVAAGAITAVCALGPSLMPAGEGGLPQLPAGDVQRAGLISFRAAGAQRTTGISNAERTRVRAALGSLDPRELLMRALPYVSVHELLSALQGIQLSGDPELSADLFVTTIAATAMSNAETEADAAYILGSDAGDDERALDASTRTVLASAIAGAGMEG